MAKDKSNTDEQRTAISEAEMNEIRENTGRELAKQPKRMIRLRKDTNPKAPNFETVQINGYTYQIQTGVEVEVPEEVYNVLVRAGLY
jgi:hypothetical protein